MTELDGNGLTLFRRRGSGRLAGVAKRLGGFGSSVVLMAAVTAASIPVVISHAGPEAWASISVSQSIAAMAAVLVAFGWGITGPSAIAGTPSDRRGSSYANATASRAWLFLLVAPATFALVWARTDKYQAPGLMAACAVILPALGAAWFYVGERRPWRLFVFDTLPRAAGTAVGGLLVMQTGSILCFTVSQAAGAATAAVAGLVDITRRHSTHGASLGVLASFRRLRDQAGGVVTAATAAAYGSLPLIVVASLVPSATAAYALADKLMKFALTALSPVFQIAQGYVPSPAPAEQRRRARSVTAAALVVGGLAGGIYALLAPWGAALFSAHAVIVPRQITWPLGIALGAIAVSAVIGSACLMAFGAVRQVALSTVLGAVIGIPCIIVSGHIFGIAGIAWSTAGSEVLVAAYQVKQLCSILETRRRRRLT